MADAPHDKGGGGTIWEREMAGFRGPEPRVRVSYIARTVLLLMGLLALLAIGAGASGGELVAKVVGRDGQVVEGHEASACEPLREDALDHVFRWPDMSSDLSGRSVAVRLRLKDAEVFSLWWG